MASIIRDASLAPQGRQKIEWARRHMAVLDGNLTPEALKQT